MKRLYIAGPMTGRPNFNYPAFHAAAVELRAAGYEVENPAEPGQIDGWKWADYMRRSLTQMLTCDGVALLPGWSGSRGAVKEVELAQTLGMRSWAVDQWIKRAA